jgi:hypothetical protein
MSADFRKVRPGQPLRITAKAWNRVLDTVSTRPEFVGEEGAYGRINHVIQIKNTTSSAVPKWGVLLITGVVNDPSVGEASLAQYQDIPILKGSTPSESTAGKFVVAVEPIAAGKIGRAAIDGVVQCKVEIANADDKFVRCKASTAELKTGSSGDGLILWKQAGTGTNKWALVRLGASRPLVRGTFTAPWSKGDTKTVTDAAAGGTTYTSVKNYLTPITGSGTKDCLIAYVAGEWVLIEFDLTQLDGYSLGKTQVLASVSGELKWLDTTACT